MSVSCIISFSFSEKVLLLLPMRRLIHMERLSIHFSEQGHGPCSSVMIDLGNA